MGQKPGVNLIPSWRRLASDHRSIRPLARSAQNHDERHGRRTGVKERLRVAARGGETRARMKSTSRGIQLRICSCRIDYERSLS